MIYGYCRATTEKQLEDGYIKKQKTLIKERYFDCNLIEETSIDINNVPEYDELSSMMKSGDIFVVTTMDRFSKSIEDAYVKIKGFRDRGIKVHILNIGLIDDSILGRVLYNSIESFNSFNNAVIIERIQSGKAKAKKIEGFKEGRPKKYTDDEIENALGLLNKYSYKKVEEITGISKSTLLRAKKNKSL